MNNEKKCICCEKVLKDEPNDSAAIGVVYDATVWRSSGNYGSTIYDPLPTSREEFLEMYLCDECLKQKQHLVKDVRCERTETRTEKTFDTARVV